MRMSGRNEQKLQKKIKELRGELGKARQALAHQVDVSARAKERVHELKEEAVERGGELRDEVLERSSALRDQTIEAAERARGAVRRTSRKRWTKLAGAGFALVALTAIVRRVRGR